MTAKIDWISAVQGTAILMVVIGHCWLISDCRLWYFCYGVHMPLFMFVSGGLFYMTRISRNWIWGDVVADKLQRLGIPYVVFIIFAYLLKIALSTKIKNPVGLSIEDFLLGFVYPMRSAMKEMWFVAALLWLMILYPLWKWILTQSWLIVAALIVFAVLSIVNKPYTGGGIFNILGALKYGIFFYCGMLSFKYKSKWEKLGWWWGLILIVIYAVVCVWFRQAQLPIALVGIGGVVLLMRCLTKRYPHILGAFRDYSMQIFLLGIYPQMFVEIFFRNMASIWWHQVLIFALSVSLGIAFPVFVAKFAGRLNNRCLNLILGLRG